MRTRDRNNSNRIVETPRASTAFGFEPLLSSRDAGWRGVTAEKYHLARCQTPAARFTNHAIFLMLGGEKTLSVTADDDGDGDRQNTRTCAAGEIAVLPMQQRFSGSVDDAGEFVVINLEHDFVQNAAREFADPRTIEFAASLAIRDENLRAIALAFKSELEAGCPNHRLFAESLAAAAAVHLVERYNARSLPVSTEYKGGFPRYKLRRVFDYIGEHLAEDLALEDLAAVAEMNAFYFARQFKQSVGVPPHQYVVAERIKLAKQLLADRKLSLIEVCLQSGFQSQNYFTTIFRRHAGVTPKQYRNRIV